MKEKDKKILLTIARKSIEEEFGKSFNINLTELKEELKEKKGCFITLHKKNKLRGCIGFPYPIFPLAEAVYKAAKEAAFSDPRFSPLSKDELKRIKIEISVLTLPKKCKPNDIEVGKDGIIGIYKNFSGLLLPQVAVEYKMNREEFLDALCEKMGLPKKMWKEKEFILYKFQAEIIKEE